MSDSMDEVADQARKRIASSALSLDEVAVQARKRIAPFESTLGRFSNLPDNVLDNIFLCLPTKDAARTSILAKKWRFKWLSTPKLVFTDDLFYESRSFKSQRCSQIHQILLRHCGPLNQFVLPFPFGWKHALIETDNSLLNQIICILTSKDIRKLTLCAPYSIEYKIPSTLYQCIQLTHLNLSAHELTLPPEIIGFSKLISLELYLRECSSIDLETFISKCPLLERLKFQTYSKNNTLEIDASNLKYLSLDCYGWPVFFKNVPVLSTVIIENSAKNNDRSPVGPSNIAKVFGSLPAIEHFEACAEFCEYLYVGIIPERLPSILSSLKSLTLSGLGYNCLEHVECALLLVRSSPNLHYLKIQGDIFYRCDTSVSELRDVLSLVGDSFNKLEEVTLKFLDGTKQELELIKRFLAKSLALRTMIIHTHKGVTHNKRGKIQDAVSWFRKASPNVEIQFFEGWIDC